MAATDISSSLARGCLARLVNIKAGRVKSVTSRPKTCFCWTVITDLYLRRRTARIRPIMTAMDCMGLE